jgi:hypothetical protein
MNEKFTKLSSQVGMIVFSVIVTGIFWFFWQKESKRIVVIADNPVSIVSLGKDKVDGLELFYNSKQIESLSVVNVLLKNSGNAPIKIEDFSVPLNIRVGGTIASGPILVENSPPQVRPKFKIVNDSTIEIVPLLLNPDDAFKFRVDVINLKNDKPAIEVDGRIVGVKNINMVSKDEGAKFIEVPWYLEPIILLVGIYAGSWIISWVLDLLGWIVKTVFKRETG